MSLFKPSRKLGRIPSDPTAPKLRLKHFLESGYVGQVPDVVTYTPDATNVPMDANDQLGDCTAAAAAHVETVFSQFGQGFPVVPSVNDVVKFYSGSTGYVPGNPSTDQGGDMLTVLKYWRQTGIAGHKLAAYFAVDPSDFEEMRAALYLFGNLYIGFYCTQGFEDAFDRGTVFDVTRRDRVLGGHCVAVHQITKGGNIKGSTWGGFFEMTPAAWLKYVDEPYTAVSQEWVHNGLTPEGLDWQAANAAFTQLTGQPGPFVTDVPPSPTPTPTPTPTPVPTPTPTPTPADVDQVLAGQLRVWLQAKGFDQQPPLHGR